MRIVSLKFRERKVSLDHRCHHGAHFLLPPVIDLTALSWRESGAGRKVQRDPYVFLPNGCSRFAKTS